MKLISIEDYARYQDAPFEQVNLAKADDLIAQVADPLKGYFDHPLPGIARLRNITFVTSCGLLVTEEGWVLKDATLSDFAAKADSVLNGFDGVATDGVLNKPTLIVGGQNNYFHWLLNWLAKLTICRKSSFANQAIATLVACEMNRYQSESLHLLKASSGLVVMSQQYKDKKESILIRDAIVPSIIHPAHNYEHVLRLREAFHSKAPGFADKIYISRKDAARGNRQITNEHEVEAFLKRYGFVTVSLSDLSVVEQAGVFAHARYIVAPHGAGLTNILHSGPETSLLEFQARDHFTRLYMTLGLMQGVRYKRLACQEQSDGNLRPYQKDITVDIGELGTHLESQWGLKQA